MAGTTLGLSRQVATSDPPQIGLQRRLLRWLCALQSYYLDLVAHADSPTLEHPSKDALARYEAIAYQIVDDRTLLTVLADLGHFHQRLAHFQARAHM